VKFPCENFDLPHLVVKIVFCNKIGETLDKLEKANNIIRRR
jgi:hypothetical protein